MIGVGELLNGLKRQSGYGTFNLNTDQAATDILLFINKRLAKIWGAADWKWNREMLSFALAINVRQYVVTSKSGNKIDRIESLIPYDITNTFLQGEPLTQRTERHFYERSSAPKFLANTAGDNTSWNTGFPTDYVITQQDANGNWNIIVDPVPNTASQMGGWAKGVLTKYVNADVVANNPILYFPNDVVLDPLWEGVMSDIKAVQQQAAESLNRDKYFTDKIKQLVANQIGVATDDSPIQTALPDTVLNMRRKYR